MKIIFSKDLSPGMVAGKDVIRGEGILKLLAQGIQLTQSQIRRIRNWGVPFLCIEDEKEKWKKKSAGVALTEAEFLTVYQETIQDIANAFRHIKKFQEVPISEMQELADQRVSLLIDTVGVLDYLHKERCHSNSTFHHSLNVAVVAGVLGKWCGYRRIDLKNIILAGLLHDIGKVAVPLAILDKPSRLSSAEFDVIKRHPRTGYQLVKKSSEIPTEVKLTILQHHERTDGSGYPCGLAAHEIRTDSKIIAIADIYDAMTSDRAYRRKVTPFEALDVIADQIFRGLEPNFGLVFLENMREYLVGSEVALSNGEKAMIIAFNDGNKYFTQPVVCIQNGSLVNLQTAGLRIVGVD
ncbi:MAG: HD-GYP domain-containing protein [Veillonellales bacterium]